MPCSDLSSADSETDDQIGYLGVYWIQNGMYQGVTQDHQIRKFLKDVRHSSGEIIDCNGETDNDVPPVTKMRKHAKIYPITDPNKLIVVRVWNYRWRGNNTNAREPPMDSGTKKMNNVLIKSEWSKNTKAIFAIPEKGLFSPIFVIFWQRESKVVPMCFSQCFHLLWWIP